ncbi:MAG: hypothetical protein AAF797_09915 [Planctomycetota bacterium]
MLGSVRAGAAGLEPYLSEIWLGGDSDWPTAGAVLPSGFEVTVPGVDGVGDGSGQMTLLVMDATPARFGGRLFEARLPAQAGGTAVAVTNAAWPVEPASQSTFVAMDDLTTDGFWALGFPVSLLLFDGAIDFQATTPASLVTDPGLASIHGSDLLLDAVTVVADGRATGIDDHADAFLNAFGLDLRESIVTYSATDRVAVRDVINNQPIPQWGVGEPAQVGGVDQFEEDGLWFAATPGWRNEASQEAPFGDPLPEPGGLVLVGVGLAWLTLSMGGRRRRSDKG